MNDEVNKTLRLLLKNADLFKSTLIKDLCFHVNCSLCPFNQICESVTFIQEELYELIGDE